MSERTNDLWEERMARTAAEFAWPSTPDMAGKLRTEHMASVLQTRRAQFARRLVLAAVVLIGLSVAVLSVPPVRAALVNLLRIGAVTIVLEPTATPRPTATPQSTLTPQPTITPTVTPKPLGSVLDLGGETTLADARTRVGFTIRLPTYPGGLGEPNAAFVQELGDQTVMLVWTHPNQPRRVRLALHQLGPNAFVYKVEPRIVSETTVNGQRAIWTVGEYMLRARNGDVEMKRLITGNVLIWTDGRLTYRLETDLPLEEAVKIAESLR